MSSLGHLATIRSTARLRLEPISHHHAADYYRVFQDDAIACWYAGKLSRAAAQQAVQEAEQRWQAIGFHKWLIYEQASGEVVGRAGLSALPLAYAQGAIRACLPAVPWVDETLAIAGETALAQRWCEIGWALRGAFWGQGYATEVGRYSLQFAFEQLDMQAVISFTERHNQRSRAVMERIGMRYVGEFHSDGLIEGVPGVHANAPFALYVALREGA